MSLAHDAQIVKLGPLTEDAFLGGRLTIAQPEKGFRAGLDSVLLGAAVADRATRLLDLGAGAGTAALVALTSKQKLDATLAESDPAMAALAVRNLGTNDLANRARVIETDITASGRIRAAAGLAAEQYDCIIANPPFFANGTAPDQSRQRRTSHAGRNP